MPRYLALDYLSKAVSERRARLEAMMLPTPHHMEIVDSYIHHGQLHNSLSLWQPWKEQDFSVDVVVSSSTDTVAKELQSLVNCYSTHSQSLEEFTETGTSEAGSDVDLFSQELASAMTVLGSGEDYPVEAIDSWELLPPPGYYAVECPESPCRLDWLLSLLPTVEDLSSRLKPKLIQDPFLDKDGQPYSYQQLTSRDCSPDLSEGTDPQESLPMNPIKEEFTAEPIRDSLDSELDPLFALPMPSEGEPLSSIGNEVQLPHVQSSPELGDGELIKDDSKDLKLLMEEMSRPYVAKLPGDHMPDLSPSAGMGDTELDFPALNNQNVSGDSDDSGIGHALLESPLLPRPHPLTSPLSQQLALLEPMPMSPGSKIVLLSPGTQVKLQRELFEGESVFDTILAHKLPCPDTSGVVEALLETNVVSDLLSLLNIAELKMSGDCELELPWDPLANHYHVMELAENSLISRQPSSPHTTHHLTPPTQSLRREEFVREKLSDEEIVEPPISLAADVDEGVKVYGAGGRLEDVPLLWSDPSPHIHTTRDYLSSSLTVHPKDAAWGLLLQSATGHNTAPTANQVYKPLIRGAVSNRFAGNRASNQITGSRAVPLSLQTNDSLESCDGLDTFLMLRSNMGVANGVKRSLSNETEGGPIRKKGTSAAVLEEIGNDTLLELELVERTATSSILDICLSDSYLSTVTRLQQLAREQHAALSREGVRVSSCEEGSLKFLLKQQQKAMADNTDPAKTELFFDQITSLHPERYYRCCQLSASLYLTTSVTRALQHCSLGVALAKLTVLCDKYSTLLEDRVMLVKRELSSLQLASDTSHPKLLELVRILINWQREGVKGQRALVAVETEFPTLSVEILDVLQSVPDLKCCVFSLLPDSSQLYLRAVEQRFQHYHCLVMPCSNLTGQDHFPWERVGLLVEYEQFKRPLFDTTPKQRGDSGPTVADRLNLWKYISLRTVGELSAPDRLTPVESLAECVQYTLIASERIIAHTQLLHLLETRYNSMVLERNYTPLHSSHPLLSYPDLLLSPCTGLVVRPLSLLTSNQGVRSLINTVTALSLQLVECWVLLDTSQGDSYPYGGSIPGHLAQLHASVAHYCPKLDQYTVKIITASSMEQVAAWVHRAAERAHNSFKVFLSCIDPRDGDWIQPEMCQREMVLLSFPCLNSLSAQLMLRNSSLGELLAMSLEQLHSLFPWLPHKVAKMFHGMCNTHQMPALGGANSAILPTLKAVTQDNVAHTDPTNPSHLPAQVISPCLNQKPSLVAHQTDDDIDSSHDLPFVGNVPDNKADFRPLAKDTITLDDSLEEVLIDENYHNELAHRPSHHHPIPSVPSHKSDHTLTQGEVIDLTLPDIEFETNNSRRFISSIGDQPSSSTNQGYQFDFSFNKCSHNGCSDSTASNKVFSKYFNSEHTNSSAHPSTTRLLSSSKALSQKQVLSSQKAPSSHGHASVGFNSQLGYVSSSVVKNKAVSGQLRTPVKSLDLGFEGQNHHKVLLQCNDRTIGSHRDSDVVLRVSDRLPDDPQRFLGGSINKSLSDSLVPSHPMISPPSKDTSLFDSPQASVMLSPARKMRRLSCQRDPSRTDGQTKLVLF